MFWLFCAVLGFAIWVLAKLGPVKAPPVFTLVLAIFLLFAILQHACPITPGLVVHP